MAAWRLRSLKCWDDQATNCIEKAEGTHRRLEMSASLAVYQLLSCWVCRAGQGPTSVGAHRQVAGSNMSVCSIQQSRKCQGHRCWQPVRTWRKGTHWMRAANSLLASQQAALRSQHIDLQRIMPQRKGEADTRQASARCTELPVCAL